MRFGCNFWLEGPIDIIRPTRLNCILQDLFRDKFGSFWDWNVRLILHCVLPHPITIKSILSFNIFLWPIPLKRCFEDSYSYKLIQYNFKYSYIKKNFTVSSSETRSIEISLVLTGEALLGCKVGKPCKCFFLVGNKLCVWMEILQVLLLALEGSFLMNTTSLQSAILKQSESWWSVWRDNSVLGWQLAPPSSLRLFHFYLPSLVASFRPGQDLFF